MVNRHSSFLSISVYICYTVYMSVFLSVCLSVSLYICLSVCQAVSCFVVGLFVSVFLSSSPFKVLSKLFSVSRSVLIFFMRQSRGLFYVMANIGAPLLRFQGANIWFSLWMWYSLFQKSTATTNSCVSSVWIKITDMVYKSLFVFCVLSFFFLRFICVSFHQMAMPSKHSKGNTVTSFLISLRFLRFFPFF